MPTASDLNVRSSQALGWSVKAAPEGYNCGFTGPEDPALAQAILGFQSAPDLARFRRGAPTGVITQEDLDTMQAIESAWVTQGSPANTLGEMINRCIQLPARMYYKPPPAVIAKEAEKLLEERTGTWKKVAIAVAGLGLAGYGIYRAGKALSKPRPNEDAPEEEEAEDEDEDEGEE